jgi:hypothetical protein
MARGIPLVATLLVLLVASAAQSAPAPGPIPLRHVPAPASLLQGFLAEGFDLCGLERGPE